jgi:hypothetical protein
MHKTITILVFLILFPLTFIEAQYFNGGVSAGITACQIDGDRLSGYNKPGFTAGVFVNRVLITDLKWQAEFRYIMKGAVKLQKANDPAMFRTVLHYFELPFVFDYRFYKNLSVEAGISPAYLWNATQNTGLGAEAVDYEINKIDLSSIAGISFLLVENLVFNFRLIYSLKPISYLEGNRTQFGYGQLNNVISLAVYYTIK